MKRIDLDIYREYYEQTGKPGKKNQVLADIWDKIANVLEEHGMSHAGAEYTGLLITEWIRRTWGGVVIVERHNGDAKEVSRFSLLRDRAIAILAEAAPAIPNHGSAVAEIVRVVRIDYQGKYIAKIKGLNQLQRDYTIWSKAGTPAQIEALALEHGISVVRAYQINKAMQERTDKREQPLLPFAEQ